MIKKGEIVKKMAEMEEKSIKKQFLWFLAHLGKNANNEGKSLYRSK
jgi:hypothetical protein